MVLNSSLSLLGNRTPEEVDQSATLFGGSGYNRPMFNPTLGSSKPLTEQRLNPIEATSAETAMRRDYADIARPVEPQTTQQPSVGSKFYSGVQTAAGIGSAIATQYTNDRANQAKANLNADLESWKNKGAYWFDPNTDIAPTFDEYIQGYPSAEKAMLDSQWFGGENEGKNDRVVGGFINPIGGIVTGITKASGNERGANRAGYAVEKGNEGALQGLSSSGWVGAIVGGVLGVIQGFFGYGSAVEDDKKARQRALEDYKLKYDAWKRNKEQQRSLRQQQFNAERTQTERQSYLNKETEKTNLRKRRTDAWKTLMQFSKSLGTKPETAPRQNLGIRV